MVRPIYPDSRTAWWREITVHRRLAAIFAFGILAMSSSAWAASGCSWVTVVGVTFGVYDVFSATPLDSTGTLTLKCTAHPTPVIVDLNRGGAPTFNPRIMLKAAEQLNYDLYMDAARTSIWGDGTSGTAHYVNNNPPNGQPFTLTVYGRIPAGQDVSAGAYADSVTATVTF
jgi:spore coat protein U-like protein